MANPVIERGLIKKLFGKLSKAPRCTFPKPHKRLSAPLTHAVYVIRNRGGRVEQVGRTHRGQHGLRNRLKDHLSGRSSFAREHLKGGGSSLRSGFTFEYLEVSDSRQRALLEFYATAIYCPRYLGLGEKKKAS